MGAPDERELVQRAADGDVNAFTELIVRDKQAFYSFAVAMAGGNHADASDVLQEALVKAYLAIGSFKGESSFRTWLWRIIRNEFLNYRKAVATRPQLLLEEEPAEKEPGKTVPQVEKQLIELERKQVLLEIIGSLPPKEREIITLVDLKEMSYEEVCKLLDITEDALKSRLFRARNHLSEIVRRRKRFFL